MRYLCEIDDIASFIKFPNGQGMTLNCIDRSRVYSDEMKMCFGVPAFNQMARAFKQRNFDAWRAWKQLV